MTLRREKVLDEISVLLDRQKKLFEALPRSIRMAQIWPEAFEDGMTCSPLLIGTSYPRGHTGLKGGYPAPYQDVRTISRTYLRRHDGVEHEITEEEFFSIITAGP